MNSTGQYYYNARWYDPSLGRFTTEDPIKDGSNWYAYANNNPLRFVDPTGLTLELSEDTGDRERELYNKAVDYLKSSESGAKLFDKLEKSETVFKVEVKPADDQYDPNTDTATWNPYSGVDIDGETQSSAMGLAHELGHARQDDLDMLKGRTQAEIEQEVVDYIEQPIAEELNEPSREKYDDVSRDDQVTVTDPTEHTHVDYDTGKATEE